MERILTATFGERRAEVKCVFKRIKNIHLKVYPDGRVLLTAPSRTEPLWIQNYIDSKAEWIFRALDKYETAERPEEGWLCVFGTPRRLVGEPGRGNVTLTDEQLVVRLPNPEPQATLRRAERFLRERAESYFRERVDTFFPLVEQFGAQYPEVSVRRMKSMWGNCNKHTGCIRFNTVLFCADPACIDYVVLHELTHLLIAGHQQDFYNFLAARMPDWKARKKRLNRCYAKYL